jgi:hypothetical protein
MLKIASSVAGEDEIDPFDAMLQRGSLLRQLRQLAEDDEMARQNAPDDDEQQTAEEFEPSTFLLSDGSVVFKYESFLRNQRVYDDLKHIDYRYIDFSNERIGHLIIEQEKSLGKGGFCWDAAYILGEYLIQEHVIENIFPKSLTSTTTTMHEEEDNRSKRIVELGTGTGLCGMILAKAIDCHATLTDLDLLMPLLNRNVARNFKGASASSTNDNTDGHDDDNNNNLDEYITETASSYQASEAKGSVEAAVLEWGKYESKVEPLLFDLVIGADIVASLYDPLALAQTVHSLSNVAVISFRERLSSVHRDFERHMNALYESVEIFAPTGCVNKNPHVQILLARHRKDVQ